MQTVRELKIASHTLTYEQRRKAEAAVKAYREGLALEAARALSNRLNSLALLGEPAWAVKQTAGNDYDAARIEVTNGRAILVVHAGGFKREDRLVAYIPTTRSVEFVKGDWDLVQVTVGFPTEATAVETKTAAQLGREFASKLGVAAVKVADLLDAEQARMLALRNKAAAIVAEFRAAGWTVHDRAHTDVAYVYVPDEHALYALGISTLKVDMDTGEVAYQHAAYLRHGTTPAQLIGLKF